MKIVALKMQCTNVLPPSQGTCLRLVLFRVIGISATIIGPCHSEIKNTKMT